MACETNDKARMMNDETNPNKQIVGRLCIPVPNAFRGSQNRPTSVSNFVIPSTFDIRISSLKLVPIRVIRGSLGNEHIEVSATIEMLRFTF